MTIARTRRTAVLSVSALAVAGLVVGLAVVPTAQASPKPSRHSDFSELTVLGSGPVEHAGAGPIEGVGQAARGGAAGSAADGAGGGAGGPALVVAPPGRSLARPDGVAASASAATIARAHLARIAPLWGIRSDTSSLRATATSEATGIGPVVRFAQLVDGVPVYGGELVVSLDDDGGLQSVGGQTADPSTRLDFTVSSTKAASVALTAAAAKLDLPARLLEVGTPFRYAYDPALVGEPAGPVVPVWRVVVLLPRSSARSVVLVSASDASVVSVSGSGEQLRRGVCNAGAEVVGDTNDKEAYRSDGAYGWCGQKLTDMVFKDTNHDGSFTAADAADLNVPYARLESGAVSSVAEVNGAFDSLGDTSALYAQLGVDLTNKIAPTDASINVPAGGQTRTLAGIVNYCDPVEMYYASSSSYAQAQAQAIANCPYANAYWFADDANWNPASSAPYPGGQMFIGAGLASSEDVIGHEMTHGVTASVNGLIYQGQSGAINESMSDVFGQLVQEYASPGTDPDWLLGEELAGPTLFGAVRDMHNPSSPALIPEGRPQPNRMTSSLWDVDPLNTDAGGVHTNSGIGNQAAWLIAHGGSFNGVSIRRLDTVDAPDSQNATLKVARLYWATQQLLPSNANYRRLAMTLVQACHQLVAQHSPGYVASDCTESVGRAVDATEMSRSKATTSASKTSVTYGKTAKVTARVTDLRGGSAEGANVQLQAQPVGTSGWATVATGTTAAGVKVWTIKPTRSTYYRAVYLGGDGFTGATTAARKITVKPSISRKVKHSRIAFGRSFKVSGTYRPHARGKVVKLQQKVHGTWHTVKKVKLTKNSRYKVRYRPRSSADRYFRVYRPAAGTYGPGASKRFKIRVR